jgi:hypothetical protein
VPIWLVTYRFGSRNFQTIVNGYTGVVAGDRPISWIKIFFYVILPAIIALVIVVLLQDNN